MRRTLMAAAAIAALMTSAQAKVDHMALTRPACVTTFHLNEADALWRAGRPVNQNVCLILKEGTEVVHVRSIGVYEQIAYQKDGRTYSLFVVRGNLAGQNAEWKAYKEKAAQEQAERSRKQAAYDEEKKRFQDDIDVLYSKYERCVLLYSVSDPICKGIDGALVDLQTQKLSRPRP